MLSNKILSILLLLTLVISLFFTGCSKSENSFTSPTAKGTSMESINEMLQNDNTISDITWSYNKSAVAYLKTIEGDKKGIFMRTLGDADEVDFKLSDEHFYDITWSPDDKYITVNKGTSNLYETLILSYESWELLDSITNGGDPVWSPDSSKIAFAILNDKKPEIPIELEGTFNIVLYDIETKQLEPLLEADNDFSYLPNSWDEGGLYYTKLYLDGRMAEDDIYSFVSPSDLLGEYEVITETTERDDAYLGLSIKYPKLVNLIDTDVENKVNEEIINTTDRLVNELIPFVEENEPKHTITIDYEITKQSRELLSIRFNTYHYINGNAYPNNYIEGLTFNLETGKKYEYIGDLFKDNVDYISVLNRELKTAVDNLDFELFKEFKGLDKNTALNAIDFFNITDDSLLIYYPVGEYTPHAVGPLLLEVKLESINKYLRDIFRY